MTEDQGRTCAFAGLDYQEDMLDDVGRSDSALEPHQQRLNQPPTRGVRDWRIEMMPADVAAFEAAAGDLLATLGYETLSRGRRSSRERMRLTAYRAQTSAWRGLGYAMQRPRKTVASG